ncbi:MAG TPA: aromatic ring-hydroxylating dioxygenase subunit alpha [Chloroflexota bacterium]|nr:aromatic ring-hydroxylating dioxygenase subunit alpha [Chloroflexota bacterium]
MHIEGLVQDRREEGVFRVHRSAMTSPEVLALERERIFGRTWLYVGHESEVPKPGDFRRRKIAGRPLFIARGDDGAVRVFYNTCLHRGALICRQDQGSARTFQCFYHGWTYNNEGKLVGIPDESGYGSGFDPCERSLQSPARVDSYRGFYFVSFTPDVPSLASWLAPIREVMDLTLDSAEVLGGWEASRSTAQFSVHANWKLLIENSIDNYHYPTTHQTYIEYMGQRSASHGKQMQAFKDRIGGSVGLAFPNGHGGFVHRVGGRPIALPSPLWSEEAQAEVLRTRAALMERFGEERATQMADFSRHLLIFPNLLFQDSQTGFRVRQIWPETPDLFHVTQMDLLPRDEREDVRAYRMEFSRAFLGPGGLATPDDVEAVESCQAGFGATEVEWSDISRGMQREPNMIDELQIRGFWRQWHALICGRDGVDNPSDAPARVPVTTS